MKRFFLFICLSILTSLGYSQEVIKWDFRYNKETNLVEIEADIQEGWHLYSQFIQEDAGPVPTTFTFQPSEQLQLTGAVAEPTPIQKYDENFEAMLDFFSHKVIFTQKVKARKAAVLEGSVTFMVCNETMCLPPVDKKFKINIPAN